MLDIAEVSNGFEVKFQYKPWLVSAIRQIPGARFNGARKHWWVPASSGAALINWAGTFGVKIGKPVEEQIGEIEDLPELDLEIDDAIYHRERKAKGESCTLYHYQKKGIAYSLGKKRLINGDDMGLGKTAQSIATLVAGGAKCILIICPATLKENWKREWKLWAGRDALILNDRVKRTWPQFYRVGMVNVFICNYESLKKYFVEKIDKHLDDQGKAKPLRLNHIHFTENISLFDAVVIDELHRCKDGSRQVSKFVMGITKGKEWVLGLTGTPVVNKPKDLISQLHIVGRLDQFGGYKRFVDRFCAGEREASNLKELNYLLNKHCFYRRLKKDVLTDLPDKIRNILLTEIDTRKEYEKAENNLIEYLRENLKKTEGEITTALRGETMVLIGILKKISARGKIAAMLEHIQEVVDAGEKIIVFAWHKEVVYELKKAVPGAVTVVGDDSMEERQKAVDSFQNSPYTNVIICNIASGGVGITLTASSRVSFIELPWHPAHADQAEDRAWRIGQKNCVQCTYILGENTIDRDIYDIIEKKRQIVGQVTGAENEIETSVVDDFINLFKTKI